MEKAAIEAIVQRLQHHRYLDDGRFAEGIARRAVRRGQGSRRARSDLHKKGIAKALIDDALARSFLDEADLARQTLSRRYKTPPQDKASRARAARFLLQRGFPQRIVLAILKEGC